ncbi:toll/interleukin-1 receptor domain-containing protein [Croceibacterium aestuarii]|uniref:toll/interleukin-1 receptor domain-containing protein n=1 Tax=Croceibacterium aestuarii TaxID=3064139 RepID=UPI00272DE833|nr:toll/interleukin-1 receptor domain-containing protein [Croceibacterium sp. D39]
MSVKVFISYSHADDDLLDRLHKHLAQLRRDGTIIAWYDREITAGRRLDDTIGTELEDADIFLACASPDWIDSNYAYETEFKRALEKEIQGTAVIVPVIFKPCDWLSTPLQQFRALPKDGKPITEFTNQDVALLDVVTGLRALARQRSTTEYKGQADVAQVERPVSRYRVQREFDELDKRDFVETAFKEMYRFFEASVAELNSIEEIECRLSPLESDYFSCTVINRGVKRGFETVHVRKGGTWGAIDLLFGEHNQSNTSNGGFSVVADNYQLALSPLMFQFGGREEDVLNARDAAKMVWDNLLSKVGIEYA